MDVLSWIRSDRIVAVIRAQSVPDPAGLVRALSEGGIRVVEFTFTIPNVTEVIAAASEATGSVIGAGTVLTKDQGRDAVEAGARFLVSPTLVPDLLEAESREPVILGALTPTEIQTAVTAGAAAIKVFPARVGGPSYLRDLTGPFPELDLIPSGGIDESNARDFIEAGAMAVYAGSSLAPAKLVETGKHDQIHERAKRFVSAIR